VKKEHEILRDYLRQKGLKQTSQRELILDTFLSTTRHISADELHGMIRKQNPRIGFSTVYRTLKLFNECGLAREVNFGDGRARFERGFDKGQHGHMICTRCGRTEEFNIASLQKNIKQIAGKAGFKAEGHRFEIYGLCKRCR
jgi:Fur family ferric uptake transcriptional regulator